MSRTLSLRPIRLIVWFFLCSNLNLQEAHAGGAFAISSQGAYALGTAFSGVASGSAGLPSMYWNPATITRSPGRQLSLGATVILPDVNITAQAGTSPLLLPLGGIGDVGADAVVPNFYGGWQVGDLWFGLSGNAPYGLATNAPHTSASQVYGRRSEVFSFSLSPVVGYRVNEWLSVGAAAQILYFKGKLTAANGIEENAPGNELSTDGYGFGYALGATITPAKGTTLGVGYRSRIDTGQSGTFVSDSRLDIRYGVDTTLSLPEMVSIGLEQVANDRTKLFATYEYTGWSTFNSFSLSSDFPGGLPPLAFRYDDGHYFSVGGEYEVTPNLNLVGGIGYQISPIGDQVRSVRLPDNNALWVGLGGRYKRSKSDHLSIDFAYAHVSLKSAPVDITSSDNPAYVDGLPFVGVAESTADFISIGINYSWD